MNTVNEVLQPYAESFKAFETHSSRDASWLRDLRRGAFVRFMNRGFPGARDEDWKYTSTRPLEKRAFISTSEKPDALTADAFESVRLRELSTYTLVFINGQYTPSLSSAMKGITGVQVSDLRQSLQQGPTTLQAWLAPEPAWNDDAFTTLNTAFIQNGLVIAIDAEVQLERPLQLIFVSTPQAQPMACHPRILMKLGAGSQATLIETYYGLEGSGNFTNSYTQIELDDHARLEYLRMQRESPEDFHVSRVAVAQQHASAYTSHSFNLGGLWVRTDLYTRLQANRAHVELNGLYSISDRQHVDNHTCIEHLAPETRSNELYHGIINDHGRAVFNGKVVVAEHAVKTDASQSNNNLLLSRGAEIDTKPELEIYADDVQCSHGATIGQLDETALFYLRSRGIDLDTARNMLVQAFANRLMERIRLPELRAYATRQMEAVRPNQDNMGAEI